MDGMLMPGGWTMSMAWMRMPGQTWPGAAASFLSMWAGMMAVMMLPSLIPMLCRYREAVRGVGKARRTLLTAIVGVGYLSVWSMLGAVVFPTGAALATIAMRQPMLARAVPTVAGVIILIAGAIQLTSWKARRLACCREMPERCRTLPADRGTAWRHGVRLGFQCVGCCGNLMAILIAVGVMDVHAMAVVTAAITTERLPPSGALVARALGALIVGVGIISIARVVGLG